MKRVMIDLETMGTTKRAAIMSIGAAVLSSQTMHVIDEFEVNVDVESCIKYGLVKDARTQEFWQRESNATALALMKHNAWDLSDALQMFRAWILKDADKEDIEPWANGTSFDLAILETAYERTDLPHPWKYSNERDYRTLKCLYRDVPKPVFNGVQHTALADAKFQAEHLALILRAKCGMACEAMRTY